MMNISDCMEAIVMAAWPENCDSPSSLASSTRDKNRVHKVYAGTGTFSYTTRRHDGNDIRYLDMLIDTGGDLSMALGLAITSGPKRRRVSPKPKHNIMRT